MGLKVHLLITAEANPLSLIISPGSEHDLTGLKLMDMPLAKGDVVYGDKAYADYEWEKALLEEKGIRLLVRRIVAKIMVSIKQARAVSACHTTRGYREAIYYVRLGCLWWTKCLHDHNPELIWYLVHTSIKSAFAPSKTDKTGLSFLRAFGLPQQRQASPLRHSFLVGDLELIGSYKNHLGDKIKQ